jgi:hypothetical protein
MHDLDENQITATNTAIFIVFGALRPTSNNTSRTIFTSYKEHADIVYWVPENNNSIWDKNYYSPNTPLTPIKLTSAEGMLDIIGNPKYTFCVGIPLRFNMDDVEKWTKKLFSNQIQMVIWGNDTNTEFQPQPVSISSDNGVPNNLLDSIEFK